MSERPAEADGPGQRVLLIGHGRLIDVAHRGLDDAGARVLHLREPTDREIRRALSPEVAAVTIVSRDDRASLRLALVVESMRPGVRLIVTIYNRDLGEQVRRAVRNVRVVSMADIVAPSLAAACVADDLAFTAIFTAGLIERLLDGRLVALLGRRAMPRRDHVVVVGLGQVGLRLCMMLRGLGVPVVAVERDPDADNIRRAKQYGIPVVIGRGNSRSVLRRLSLSRARALAAVSSDEVENIAAAMVSLSIRADLRTVLRAGSGDMMDETRALFRIGAVRDVYRIGGTLIAAATLGSPAEEAFVADGSVWLIGHDARIERFAAHLTTAASDARAGTAPGAPSPPPDRS